MADFTMGGSWEFNQLSSSGLANVVTPNVVYFDTGTGEFSYGSAGGGGSSWLLGGNSLMVSTFLGTTNPEAIQIGTNNITCLTIDANQNIAFNAPSGSNFVLGNFAAPGFLRGQTLEIQTGSTLNMNAANLLIGTNATVTDTSVVVGNFNVATTIRGQSVLLTATGAGMDLETTGTLQIGTDTLTTLTMVLGNTACTTSIDGSDLLIPNLGSQTGDVAVPSTINPAGYATVLVEIATGKLSYYVQS